MKSDAGAVLIIGAGIGGIKAAFDVAELGHQVYLVDQNPFMGGTLSQLDRQFPTNRCCMCQLLPTVARHGTVHYCLRRELYHPNILAIPGSKVINLAGSAGDFKASIRTQAMTVDPDKCINCGACEPVCPVEVEDEFQGKLKMRKAIYARYPLPMPNMYAIDAENCTRCGECVKICPTRAINLDAAEKMTELEVGSIIIASGFEEFNPKILMQYGHGRYPDVLTSIELERMFSGYGVGKGDIFRPSNGEKPKNIAFIQCVGSRDQERNYCSAACCMYALKEAMIIREENPDLDIYFFYMDARAYGKGYHRFLEDAQQRFHITFTRSRIPVIKENPATKKMVIRFLNEQNKQHSVEFDLIVLSIGQVPAPFHRELAQTLGIDLNHWGFCKTDPFTQVATSREGIFVCGAFSEPKDIPESITQASAAAAQAVHVLKSTLAKSGKIQRPQEDVVEKPPYAPYYDENSESFDWEKKTAVFICECGGEISKILDIKKLTQFAQSLPHVTYTTAIHALCARNSLEKVTQQLVESKVSRVIFAACVPYHYQHLFEATSLQAGIQPGYVRIANIREHAAWPHADDSDAATKKAQQLILMQYEFLQQEENLELASARNITQRALVIGGGAAGMSAALGLANLGIGVDLIEKTEQLGGRLEKIYFSPHAEDPQQLLQELRSAAESNELIKIYFQTQLHQVSGEAGVFSVLLKNSEPEPVEQLYGAIIVATGGQEHIPVSYAYGKSPQILTQQQFKEKVVAGEIDMAQLKQVVMIQCVESRDEKRPYCSRICCTQAITNALKIKEANPTAEVVIFNRDIMTYGFREQYYTKLRELGGFFIRYEPGREPQVTIEKDKITITAIDPVLNQEIVLQPDLLLLSTGIEPIDNSQLAKMLNVKLDADNFFQEAEVKFRPVDFHRDGIYLAGLAHSPRFLEETITQGYAAAVRAASLLTKEKLTTSPLVAEVNPRRCSGCQMCIPSCVYNARIWDEETHTVLVREALCQGCGACAMVCPNNACKLKGYRDKQVMSVIDTAFSLI